MTHSPESPFTCLRGVVLDWAGTAVDFGCQGPVRAFMDGFAAESVPVAAAEAREPMGRDKRDHVAAMFAMPRIAGAWVARYGRAPEEEDIDRVYDRVETLMNGAIREFSVPIPGVTDMIFRLRELGLRIGSCTGIQILWRCRWRSGPGSSATRRTCWSALPMSPAAAHGRTCVCAF